MGEVRLTVDKAIFQVALVELERCDSQAVALFLSAVNSADLFELSIEGPCCVVYPSRLMLGFIAECEALGLCSG